MELNEAVIPHYRSEMIPTRELKKMVMLNEAYLKEKPTWYMIDDKLQYFKVRNDFRLFTEQFFSRFGKTILGLDTLDYQIAYVRTLNPLIRSTEEIKKCGLLSENFQISTKNYYLVSELSNAQISAFINYGGYTLENLLHFFKDFLAEEDYTKCELFLIKLFISDFFTHQEDRNHNNIGFEIDAIKGVPYTRRLFPDAIAKLPNSQDYLEGEKLKGLTPSKVFDNERILGTDHKNVFTYKQGDVWSPLFPYSNETLFKDQIEARECYEGLDNVDPNLFYLYCNYTKIAQPILERLAYDDEYRKILESFKGAANQINLKPASEERITNLFEDKRKEIKKILSI